MDTSTIISLTGKFLKFVGETLADVKRQDLANVDAELLKLKRRVLAENLKEFKSNLNAAANQERRRPSKTSFHGDLPTRRSAKAACGR